MNGSIFDTLFEIMRLVSPLLIFIASITLLSKRKGLEATLLTVGSGLTLLMSLFYLVLSLAGNSVVDMEHLTSVYNIAGILSFLFYLIFAIGFFKLLFKLANQPTEDFSQIPPNNY